MISEEEIENINEMRENNNESDQLIDATQK